MQPLLVAALSWLVTARRPRWLDLAVGCAAVVGVGLVVSRPGAGVDPVGVLAAVGANVSFAAGVVLTKRFPVPPHRFAATGWQLLLGGVFLLPFLDGHEHAVAAELAFLRRHLHENLVASRSDPAPAA